MNIVTITDGSGNDRNYFYAKSSVSQQLSESPRVVISLPGQRFMTEFAGWIGRGSVKITLGHNSEVSYSASLEQFEEDEEMLVLHFVAYNTYANGEWVT